MCPCSSPIYTDLGVVSAPLWSSVESKFAGMLTISDLVHLMQYYYATTSSYEGAADDVEQLTLGNLRGEFENVHRLNLTNSIHKTLKLLSKYYLLLYTPYIQCVLYSKPVTS